MGLTYVTVNLEPLARARGKSLEESVLVDTGAIDCLVAATKLRRARSQPAGGAAPLADARATEWDVTARVDSCPP
jgi:hypothetical protein